MNQGDGRWSSFMLQVPSMLHVSRGCYAGFRPFSVTCSFPTQTFFLARSTSLLCYALPSPLSAATLILDTASTWLLSLHPSSSWSCSIGESLVIYRSTQSNSSFQDSNFTALIPLLFCNGLSSLFSMKSRKRKI